MTNQRSWFKTYQPINRTKDQPIENISGIKTRARGLGDILVRIKKGDNYEMNVLIDVLHVPNLGRSLFSCYRTTQKNIFTLHMKDGSQLIQEGNVVMTMVTQDKMYQLEIEVLTQDDLEVVHANVARLFSVETKKESLQMLFMWHR
jgi:hypothetical protein